MRLALRLADVEHGDGLEADDGSVPLFDRCLVLAIVRLVVDLAIMTGETPLGDYQRPDSERRFALQHPAIEFLLHVR